MQFRQNDTDQSKSTKLSASHGGTCFVSLETHDPSEFEISMRPWELMARPTASGSFRHRVSMLRAQTFFLYQETFELPMSTLGLCPKGMLGIAVADDVSDAKYWGVQHGDTSCPMTLFGPLDVTWTSQHSHFVAFVGTDVLRESVSEQEYERLIELGTLRLAPVMPATRLRLARLLNAALKTGQTSSVFLPEDDFLVRVQEELCSMLGLISRQSLDKTDLPSQPARKHEVKLVWEVLADTAMNDVKISELCRIAGMSERSLRYAFNEEFGLSPHKFLAMRRLHAVRQSLLIANPAISSVTETATSYGFFELGRFAGMYRAHFGELPSETLQK
jgi:AraC family ethanolamine operon transcriptional activator